MDFGRQSASQWLSAEFAATPADRTEQVELRPFRRRWVAVLCRSGSQIGYCYCCNRMHDGRDIGPRAGSLIDATYRVISGADEDAQDRYPSIHSGSRQGPTRRIERFRANRSEIDRTTGGRPSKRIYAPRHAMGNPLRAGTRRPTNRLAAATRKAGARVIWLQMTLEQESERWSVYFDFIRRGKDKAKDIKTLSRGTEATPCTRTSMCRQGISASRKRATAPSFRDRPSWTMFSGRAGLDTLIIVGTVTNGCCECTARDAMMLNYKVIFVSDANAARTDEEHNGAVVKYFAQFRRCDFDRPSHRAARAGRRRAGGACPIACVVALRQIAVPQGPCRRA